MKDCLTRIRSEWRAWRQAAQHINTELTKNCLKDKNAFVSNRQKRKCQKHTNMLTLHTALGPAWCHYWGVCDVQRTHASAANEVLTTSERIVHKQQLLCISRSWKGDSTSAIHLRNYLKSLDNNVEAKAQKHWVMAWLLSLRWAPKHAQGAW